MTMEHDALPRRERRWRRRLRTPAFRGWRRSRSFVALTAQARLVLPQDDKPQTVDQVMHGGCFTAEAVPYCTRRGPGGAVRDTTPEKLLVAEWRGEAL